MNPYGWIVWVVVAALVAGIVAAGVLSARARRRAAENAAAPPPVFEPDAAAAPVRGTHPDDGAPDILWGLHVPGDRVQRMAKSIAAGFAAIDPEETSEVVYSRDGGGVWHVLPRELWFE